MTTPIETYVNALKGYYEAVWAATPAGTDEERVRHFRTLNNYLMRLDADDEAPAELPGNLRTHVRDAATLAEVIRVRQALRTPEEAVHEDEMIRTHIVRLTQDRLQNLLLNTANGSFLEGGTIGTLESDDIETTVGLAADLEDTLTEDMTQQDALAILQGWIRRTGGLEAQVSQPLTPAQRELAQILEIEDPDRDKLRSYTLTNDQYLAALRTFQRGRGIDETNELNQETIRALMGADSANGSSTRADRWLEGIRGFWSNATAVSADVSRTVTESVDELVNDRNGEGAGAGDGAGAGSNNGILDRIGRLFSGGDGSLNWGSIIAGILGAGGALLVSNALPPMFRWVGFLLAIPAFFAAAQMGRNWGSNNDDAPAAGGTDALANEGPAQALERSQPAPVLNPEEARRLGAELLASSTPSGQPDALAPVDASQALSPSTFTFSPPSEPVGLTRPA